MRRRLLLAALPLVLLAPTGQAAQTAQVGTLCSVQDERVVESSGLVVLGDGRLVTHNDSGDDAMTRTEIAVHRVAEAALRGRAAAVPATTYRFAYPDGAHDAETLLAHPRTGQLFVVTKSYTGTSLVYAAPTTLDPRGTNALALVGRFQLLPTATPGGPLGPVGQLATTGGDVSPAADRVAVRTYTDVYEWTVRDGDVAGAFAGTPVRTALPETAQGEAVAYDRASTALLTTTEGLRAPVHRLVR